MSAEYRPLAGIRVLDLTKLVPGDLATLRLAELGADVVKVEDRGRGDYVRLIPPMRDGISVHHSNLNRGKRSIALDLDDATDRSEFDALAEKADVIVEVSSPGRYEAMGVDFVAMRERRPALVVCSITGFGQSGPFAALPSHGMNIDALSGNVLLTQRGGRPAIDYRLSTSIASEMGAANAALAITAAVLGARSGLGGAWIDISCWDAGVEIHRRGLVMAQAGIENEGRLSDAALYAPYACADGKLFIFCAIEQKFWEAFCGFVERPDLRSAWQGPVGGVDYRFGDNVLRAKLDAIFATRTAAEWFEICLARRIPGCPMLDEHDLVAAEHSRARGLITDPLGESPFPTIRNPIRFASHDQRAGEGIAGPPRLDADHESVLRDWLN